MKQITIVTASRDGLVADISKILGDAGVNIESLEAFGVQEWGIVQLRVDHYDISLHTLHNAGYDAVTEDAVVLSMKDEPGALARVTQRLHDGGIHVHNIRILERGQGTGLVAVVMDNRAEGIRLIEDLLISRHA